MFQEVFLRLVKYKERIQGREHLKAWLLRVTVKDVYKRQEQGEIFKVFLKNIEKRTTGFSKNL